MDACIFDGVQHSVLCEAFDRISLIPPRTPSPPFEDKAKPSRGGPVERGGPEHKEACELVIRILAWVLWQNGKNIQGQWTSKDFSASYVIHWACPPADEHTSAIKHLKCQMYTAHNCFVFFLFSIFSFLFHCVCFHLSSPLSFSLVSSLNLLLLFIFLSFESSPVRILYLLKTLGAPRRFCTFHLKDGRVTSSPLFSLP